MDLDRYLELRLILQQWRLHLAASIRGRIEASPRSLRRLEAIYEREGAGEEFTLWIDRWCRQAAIQLILRILFLRVLEDRNLLGATRLRNADGQQMWRQLTRNLGVASYVQWCSWDAAHLLPDLFSPTDYDLVLPEDDLVQRFLDDVWRRPDSNRPNWLRFDFRPDPDRADAGFQTRFIGDLYQELDAEIRARYALLQTPDFISQFILEHTLLKRFEEKDFREVTLIDPTCGSGHLEVDAFWMFVARYEAAAGKTREQLTVAERTQIARTIVEQHLFGCDINPYATALTRFRLLLAACDYAQPASLRDLRDLRFNIVTIDSLIPYERLALTEWQAGSQMAQAMGQPDTIQRALPILRRRYDVVVGNPPYISPQDAIKRDLYRQYYTSAYGKFGLAAPFTERFLLLAAEQGYMGMINSNAFARRQYGQKLIEDVLPSFDLQAVIDLSGAYIPGHGTPTLILFARQRRPINNTLTVISSLKGEPGTPPQPANGKVWQAVVRGYTSGAGYSDPYVDVASVPRSLLAKHPWQFGGPKNRLYTRIQESETQCLADFADSVGIQLFTLTDEVYVVEPDAARRFNLSSLCLRRIVLGEELRDWVVSSRQMVVFPYTSELCPFDIDSFVGEKTYLSAYRHTLANTLLFGGKTKVDSGKAWFEYGRLTVSKLQDPLVLGLAEISTHNHIVLSRSGRLFNRTAPVIKLKKPDLFQYQMLAGILGSNIAAFFLKQVCFNKGAGDDPIRDRYVYAGNYVGLTPLPRDFTNDTARNRLLLQLAQETVELAEQMPSLDMGKLFESTNEGYQKWNAALDSYSPPHSVLGHPFLTASQLRQNQQKAIGARQTILHRMILLQEEMDWLAYEMYGVIKKAPMAEDYLTPSQYRDARLQLGQRPFEITGRGYLGDWPAGYQPDPLPDTLRPLTEARIALIQSNTDIALLEDPLYKRRWVPPDYDKEFLEAAEWWLAEKLEFALEHYGKPISLQSWARLLARDERVNATLEVLTGSPMFDAEQELLKVIRANAVPNRPEHYLKPAGLRKFYAARQARPAAPDEPPPVPEYSSTEFGDATAWRLRGKLNIPRERFIAYAEFDHTQRGSNAPNSEGPWYGWAGWDAGQRADALAFLLDRANRAGWQMHYQQCGLRAALRELLPDLKKSLPQGEYLEFEGIAGRCGIGMDTPCYCQAYRDGIAKGQAGVPGVGAEVLNVKILVPEVSKRTGRKKSEVIASVSQPSLLD